MTIEQIYNNIENGVYTTKLNYPEYGETEQEGYITDENKSVIWNKQQVTHNKNRIKLARASYKMDREKLIHNFKMDVITYLVDTYKYHTKQAQLIYNKGWETGHDYSISQVLRDIEELVKFINDFNNVE